MCQRLCAFRYSNHVPSTSNGTNERVNFTCENCQGVNKNKKNENLWLKSTTSVNFEFYLLFMICLIGNGAAYFASAQGSQNERYTTDSLKIFFATTKASCLQCSKQFQNTLQLLVFLHCTSQSSFSELFMPKLATK